MNQHHQTAQRHMVTNVPTAFSTATIRDIRKIIEQPSSSFDTIEYIYIINRQHQLVGVLSIKELFEQHPDTIVHDCMMQNIVTVRPHTDQERVAHIALEHSIKSVPIVDKQGLFLGVVPSDTILEILNQEHTEDLLRLAGFDEPVLQSENPLSGSIWFHVTKRFPWLFLGLLGGIVAAFIVKFFETSLESFLVLAAFIPAIVYIADAVGSQTQIIFIRTMSLHNNLPLRTYITREIAVTGILALMLGILFFVIASIIIMPASFAIIIGIAIIITILASMMVGLLLPWILHKKNIDPAVASGPFATVIRDLMSLIIYFAVIQIFM